MRNKFKSIIGAIAPELVKTLVPGGPLLSMGIRVLSETLLGKPDGTETEIESYIDKATPEQLAQIKNAEVRIKALDVDLEKVHADDRDSARKRHAAMKDNTPAIIGVAVFLGFFGILGVLMFYEVPAASMSPLNIMLGALATIIVQVANYYFGSSKGSAQKNETIAGLMK